MQTIVYMNRLRYPILTEQPIFKKYSISTSLYHKQKQKPMGSHFFFFLYLLLHLD